MCADSDAPGMLNAKLRNFSTVMAVPNELKLSHRQRERGWLSVYAF